MDWEQQEGEAPKCESVFPDCVQTDQNRTQGLGRASFSDLLLSEGGWDGGNKELTRMHLTSGPRKFNQTPGQTWIRAVLAKAATQPAPLSSPPLSSIPQNNLLIVFI